MPLLSAEQQNLIRDYVFLSLVLYIFNRDKQVLATSTLKSKAPYIQLLDRVVTKVQFDLTHTKRTLRSQGIKIYKESRSKQGTSVNYCFAGYHYVSNYHWEYTKADIESYMNQYLRLHGE